MNERANELIKSIPDLKYDANTGMFETDRRALYDLVELIVRECANHCDLLLDHKISSEWSRGTHDCSRAIKKHFGVEE